MTFFSKRFCHILNLICVAGILTTVQSCIDTCESNNSTIATLKIDSAGKDYPVTAKIVIDNMSYDSLLQTKNKLSSFFIPLNLNQDFTDVSVARGLDFDTAIYSFRLNYKRVAFNKGPDCGMDIRIDNLSISDIKVVTASKKERTISLPKTELNLDNNPNVKISF